MQEPKPDRLAVGQFYKGEGQCAIRPRQLSQIAVSEAAAISFKDVRGVGLRYVFPEPSLRAAGD